MTFWEKLENNIPKPASIESNDDVFELEDDAENSTVNDIVALTDKISALEKMIADMKKENGNDIQAESDLQDC